MVCLSSKKDTALPIVIQGINVCTPEPESLEGQHLAMASSCHEWRAGAGVSCLNISTPERGIAKHNDYMYCA